MRSRARLRRGIATRGVLLSGSLLLGLLSSTLNKPFSRVRWGDMTPAADDGRSAATSLPMLGVCGELYGRSVIFDVPLDRSACCGGKPACAHLLGTTMLPYSKRNSRT